MKMKETPIFVIQPEQHIGLNWVCDTRRVFISLIEQQITSVLTAIFVAVITFSSGCQTILKLPTTPLHNNFVFVPLVGGATSQSLLLSILTFVHVTFLSAERQQLRLKETPTFLVVQIVSFSICHLPCWKGIWMERKRSGHPKMRCVAFWSRF